MIFAGKDLFYGPKERTMGCRQPAPGYVCCFVAWAAALAAVASGAEAEIGLVAAVPVGIPASLCQLARESGCEGMLLLAEDDAADLSADVRDAADACRRHNLKLWLGCRWPAGDGLAMAEIAATMPVEGLAIVMPPPSGEPIEPGDLDAQLALKRQGETLAESIRQIKSRLGRQKGLVLCTAASQIDPETARGMFVPLKGLIRDATVDGARLSEAEGINLHRLRLLRDAPLSAGMYLDGRSVDQKQRAGMIGRAVLSAVQNGTSDGLWLVDLPAELACRLAADALRGYRKAEEEAAALAGAIAAGTLVVDQEVDEKGAGDQATAHGIAQRFVPSRDGECPVVQIYASLRGCQGALPPPLVVEIRPDEGGTPGKTVLASAEIPATDLGHEPGYRWASARFASPVTLRKGESYWIHLPDATHPEGTYVWRLRKDGAGPRGHSWSRRYVYLPHSWVFRVYLTKEAGR